MLSEACVRADGENQKAHKGSAAEGGHKIDLKDD